MGPWCRLYAAGYRAQRRSSVRSRSNSYRTSHTTPRGMTHTPLEPAHGHDEREDLTAVPLARRRYRARATAGGGRYAGERSRSFDGWRADAPRAAPDEAFTRVRRQRASLQRQGRFGTFSAVRGQEASVVGSAIALDRERDWIVPQYRELPALLHHGLPLRNFILYFSGHPAGGHIRRVYGYCPCRSRSPRSCPRPSDWPGG